MNRHDTPKPLGKQQNNKRHTRLHIPEPLIALGVSLVFLLLSHASFFREYELKTYDLRFRLKPSAQVSDAITHVDIDDKSIALVGKWPWSRDKHAALVEILNECGAHAIAFDILFIEAGRELPRTERYKEELAGMLRKVITGYAKGEFTPVLAWEEELVKIQTYVEEEMIDEDEAFSEAIRSSHARVYLPFYIPDDREASRQFYQSLKPDNAAASESAAERFGLSPEIAPKAHPRRSANLQFPTDEFLPHIAGTGFVNSEPDVDGSMRRSPLLWQAGKRFYPQMFFQVALDYAGAEKPVYRLLARKLEVKDRGRVILSVPVGGPGEMLVHYAGKWNTDFPHLPYSTVLAVRNLRQEIANVEELLDRKYGQGTLEQLRREMMLAKLDKRLDEIAPLAERYGAKQRELVDFLERTLERGLERYAGSEPPASFRELQSERALLGDLQAKETELVQKLTQLVAGKIVIVGLTATGTHDIKPMPLQAAYPMVGMNANIVNTILTKNFIREAPGWVVLVVIFASALLICPITKRHSNWRGAFFTALYLILYTLGAYVALSRWGVWIPTVAPLGTAALTFVVITTVHYTNQELEKRWIKNAFQSYLSESVVEEIIRNPDKLKLGGEMRNMTLLFADIRGFTTISEQFEAGELTHFINRFLTPMTDIIMQRRGTIDKYMGDCIMAFWNAPLDDSDHARNACRSALAMRDYLVQWNRELKAEREQAGKRVIEIHIGIGLNTGNCCVGNMGSDQRFDYSVIGDEVNLASRLEGQSKTYRSDIVIGQNTYDQAQDFAALELDLIQVKGKTKPVRIFVLLGDAQFGEEEEFRKLVGKHKIFLTAYRAQAWDEAETLLEECRNLDTARTRMRTFYDLYADRIRTYRANPPTADWDGVHVALSK
jgi:class 3 adenylate cyclase/CHASE2 domain-containing sensor protein